MRRYRQEPDIMDADGFSVAELRKMAFEDKGPLSRPLALALLGRKRYPRKTQDLERFVMDETETPRLRNMAALELGRLGTPAAVKALERGLSVKEDVSLRGVLEGISLTGVDRIHPEINRLKRRKGPVGETARRTAALLTHRLGLRGAAMSRPEGGRQTAIEIGRPRRSEIEAALSTLAKTATGLKLMYGGAVSFRCDDQKFMFMLRESIGDQPDLTRLVRHKAELAVVAARKEREHSGWALKYHVLTAPMSKDEIRIVVSTAKGRVTLEGIAKVERESADFQVHSVGGAGAVAIEVGGTYDGQKITFTNARSGVRRRPSPSPFLSQR